MTRRIARNAASLTVGNAAVRIVTAAATVIVARYLGPSEYGVLGAAVGFTAVAAFMTDLGSGHLMVREGTRPGADLRDVLFTGAVLRLLLAIATTIVTVSFAVLAYAPGPLRTTILIVALPSIWATTVRDFVASYFTIRQEMHLVATLRLTTGLVQSAILGLGVILSWPVTLLGGAYGAASSASAVVAVLLLWRKQGIRGHWLPRLLTGWTGFILGGMLATALPQLGAILLPKATTLEATGVFLAAYKIPLVLYAIPGSIAAAFLPQLFMSGSADRQEHEALCVVETQLMTSLGLALALPIALGGHWIIVGLFGHHWAPSATLVLRILAPVVLLQSLNFSLADSMTTRGHQDRRVMASAIAAAAGAVLYLTLGHSSGAVGGAIAAVAIEVTMCVGFFVFNPLRLVLLATALRTLGRGLGLASPPIVLYAVGLVPVWVPVFASPLFVVAGLLMSPTVSRHIGGLLVDRPGPGVRDG